MAALQQTIRDNALYAYGFLQGRTYALPRSFSELYAVSVSKVTSFISLPLPLLSFLALPVFGGTLTSINLLLFYFTWSSLVLTHEPLSVEVYGALAVRVLLFLLPAFGFLAFDLLVPSASQAIKAYGDKQLPPSAERQRLARVAGIAVLNVTLSIALQAGLEILATDVLHVRSILKVTTTVPLPWNMAKDVLKGLALRGILHYAIHRYFLHTYDSPLRTWHLTWHHSFRLPFSLLAAYDHPVCYLLAHWLPSFLSAYCFRFHVLTFHIFLALISLEDLFLYSGYAILPSSIVLAGMARRTDMHFIAVASGQEACNFGHWGILDFVLGTYCKDTNSVLDDLQDEAEKHRIEERAQNAARSAIDRFHDSQQKSRAETGPQSAEGGQDGEYAPEDDDDNDREVSESARDADQSGGAADEEAPAKRRSGRRRRKA